MESGGILTTILATWGAILSTVAIGWNIFRDLSDRGELRVTCYIGKLIGGTGPADPTDYLVYSITNVGRQPIFLTHFGGKNGRTEFIITPRERLPKMLQPGEYIVEYSHELKALGAELRSLGAWDSLGRFYAAPQKQARSLKSQYARQLGLPAPNRLWRRPSFLIGAAILLLLILWFRAIAIAIRDWAAV